MPAARNNKTSRNKRNYKDMDLRPARRLAGTQQWNTSKAVDRERITRAKSAAIPGVAHLEFDVEEGKRVWQLFGEDKSVRAGEGKVLLLLICHMLFPRLFWWMACAKAMGRLNKFGRWGGKTLTMLLLDDLITELRNPAHLELAKAFCPSPTLIKQCAWLTSHIQTMYRAWQAEFPVLHLEVHSAQQFGAQLFPTTCDPSLVFLATREWARSNILTWRRKEMRDVLLVYGLREERYLHVGSFEERQFDWILRREMPGPHAAALSRAKFETKQQSDSVTGGWLYQTCMAMITTSS